MVYLTIKPFLLLIFVYKVIIVEYNLYKININNNALCRFNKVYTRDCYEYRP